MSEKLNEKELEEISGGTNDTMYIRKCCNCEFEFDIRTVNYKTETTKENGEGYIGEDKTIFYECPACQEYTPTKSRNSD